ncbi:MAG TPA: PAAR domain-containing protein [Phenylobacterium sp.]|nr:PAAR domain-containing protein [Phenylobacterium sp.]
MPPAARFTDMHTCPMVTGVVPHVGGPILPPCSPNVIVGGLPQARVFDLCTCAGGPDTIIKGSATVLVNGLPAARMGDMTVHGGVIVTGFPNVMLGG